MSILERIRQRAAAKPQHIVLPEGNDPRTVVAAGICARDRLARITLLGDEATIRDTAQREGVELGGVEVIDHRRAPDFEKMASFFHELRRLYPLFRGDQIEGSELVVLPPPPPVRKLFHLAFDVRLRHFVLVLRSVFVSGLRDQSSRSDGQRHQKSR